MISRSDSPTMQPDPLVAGCPKIEHKIGVTLNHPRTPKFLKATSDIQKKNYIKIFHNIVLKTRYSFLDKIFSDYTIEYNKDGNTHLHGVIKITTEIKGCVAGLIADIVKHYHAMVRKCYNPKCYYPEYQRYRDPSIVVQYYDDDKSFEEYIAYMYKEDYNKE